MRIYLNQKYQTRKKTDSERKELPDVVEKLKENCNMKVTFNNFWTWELTTDSCLRMRINRC